MANFTALAVAAVATQVGTILTTGSYRTNIGATVETELTQARAGDDLPRCVVVIASASPRTLSTRRRQRDMRLIVEVQVDADSTNAQATAHDCLEDLFDCFPSRFVADLDGGARLELEPGDGRIVQRGRDNPDAIAVQLELNGPLREPQA
jgi:hypothetical protein